jgi:hypothetical protein
MSTPERRRQARVRLRNPLRAAVGQTCIYVVDVSPIGIGVAHEAPLPAICRVEVLSDIGPIKLDCAIVRTVKRSAADAAQELFHSGLEVLSADPQSRARLRSVTTDRVR